MTELAELGKYGVIGVFLALIGLVIFVVKLLYSFATNHVQHTNEFMQENTKATTQLTDAVKEIGSALKEKRW